MFCSSLGGHPRPPPPDATAVLAAVKVVRLAGRSTLTAAAGRRLQQLRWASLTKANPHGRPTTVDNFIRSTWADAGVANWTENQGRGRGISYHATVRAAYAAVTSRQKRRMRRRSRRCIPATDTGDRAGALFAITALEVT
jgi:hypothetical protein